jgi:hypothetical protein
VATDRTVRKGIRQKFPCRCCIAATGLKVWFDFQFDGQTWQGTDLMSTEKVFDALSEGQIIPIRILPRTGRPLIEFDET